MFVTYKELIKKNKKLDEELLEFWNNSAIKQGYKEFTLDTLRSSITKHENFNPELAFIFLVDEKIKGFVCGCVGDNISYGDVAGYITCIIFSHKYETEENIEEALILLEKKVSDLGRERLDYSFFNPMKLSWYMEDTDKHEHNNRPGVLLGSNLYNVLCKNGYKVHSRECSMHMDLTTYKMPKEMKDREAKLKKDGYTIDYYSSNPVKKIDKFVERLNNPMWSVEIPACVKEKKPIIFVEKDGNAVGFTGPTIREESGRGYFSGIAVDRDHEGKGIGTLLFHKLCVGFQKVDVQYMTLFTGKNNKALEIYKKVGFTVQEEFATMRKSLVKKDQFKDQTILAIGGHIGDAELTSGMLMAKYALGGAKIATLALTAGEKGCPKGADIKKYRKQKVAEAEAFAHDLGGEAYVLDYPDGLLKDDEEARFKVAEIIRKVRPTIIVTHFNSSMHKDHQACHNIVIDARFFAALPGFDVKGEPCFGRLYFAENWEDGVDYVPHTYVDVSEGYTLWKKAIKHHRFVTESTSCEYLEYYDALTRGNGIIARCHRAETFQVPKEENHITRKEL